MSKMENIRGNDEGARDDRNVARILYSTSSTPSSIPILYRAGYRFFAGTRDNVLTDSRQIFNTLRLDSVAKATISTQCLPADSR